MVFDPDVSTYCGGLGTGDPRILRSSPWTGFIHVTSHSDRFLVHFSSTLVSTSRLEVPPDFLSDVCSVSLLSSLCLPSVVAVTMTWTPCGSSSRYMLLLFLLGPRDFRPLDWTRCRGRVRCSRTLMYVYVHVRSRVGSLWEPLCA